MNDMGMARNPQKFFKPWKRNEAFKLIVEEKEITDHKKIPKNIKAFYETLFKWNFSKTNVETQQFLHSLNTKTLTN